MLPIVRALLAFFATVVRPRLSRQLEIVALRHQLAVDLEIDPTPAHSSRRPHPLVLDLASLVK